MTAVTVREYRLPEPERAEILRYAGMPASTSPVPDELTAVAEKLREAWNSCRVAACEVPLRTRGDLLDFGFASVVSSDLAALLRGCDRAVIFAATVGLAPDRLIAKYSRTYPARALWAQALGAERIETLCDLFCADLAREEKARQRRTVTRFSPGYGDLPLDFQKEIFGLLDCPRRIGLTLNGSLLMSPTKSVTAIVGTGKEETL